MDFYTKNILKRKNVKEKKKGGVSYCLTAALLSIFALSHVLQVRSFALYQNNVLFYLFWTPGLSYYYFYRFSIAFCLQVD